MKILMLGVSGMIGHRLFAYFSTRHETYGTIRGSKGECKLDQVDRLIEGVDVRKFNHLKSLIAEIEPEVVINCTGIVKQLSDSQSIADQIQLNALTPHLLAEFSVLMGFKSVSFSSDCVFNGSKGNYKESDLPDATDIYGLTKALGEVNYANALTIRTSTVGLELANSHGLVEWFLAQKGEIQGFDKAIYSGLTTVELAKYLEHVLINYPSITGIFQMAADKITKFELLRRLSRRLERDDIDILKNSSFECDRSLDGDRLQMLTGYSVPTWDVMLTGLAQEVAERRVNE